MLVALSGLQGSGKDTAAAILVSRHGYTKVAFADALRELLLGIDPLIPANGCYEPIPLSEVIEDIGWDVAKRTIPEVRRVMQRTGTEGIRKVFGENAWVDVLWHRYPDLFDSETRYVITDCRFQNEGKFVRDNGGTILWIDRPGIVSDGHASESTVVRDLANAVIVNDGSIVDLQNKVTESLTKKEV
jgi:hypothetical protein